MANNKKWVWLGLVCLLGGSLPALQAAPQQIEEQVAQPGSLQIPYQVYRLENGLTLILMPDHSDPLVHVNVTYHVGAAREQQGMTGFAHFFEHMMFQGSQHVADEQHFEVVTEAGGTLNGTTNTDRTNYFETVPSNQLEKMLWLESDRMGFLLPALTSEKFEVQRETVKNERAQRIDNQPYGRMSERFNQAMFPVGHPYSWPVIGWPEDLNRATVDDVKHFFQRWYGPNNATLTIGGDFDEQQALAYGQMLDLPIVGQDFINHLKQSLIITANQVDSEFPDNQSVELHHNEIMIRKSAARNKSAQLEKIDKLISERLPDKNILDILTETEKWLDLHKQFKPKTVKRKIASLKAFFRYLEYQELLSENPFLKYWLAITYHLYQL
jgi:predicted Zn-dependent peptidase